MICSLFVSLFFPLIFPPFSYLFFFLSFFSHIIFETSSHNQQEEEKRYRLTLESRSKVWGLGKLLVLARKLLLAEPRRLGGSPCGVKGRILFLVDREGETRAGGVCSARDDATFYPRVKVPITWFGSRAALIGPGLSCSGAFR